MSVIKFRKSFSEFMIPIALLEKFGCLIFITRVEVCNMIAHSSKPNKVQVVGKDQEKAQSEKDFHSKNRGGKK